MVLLVRNCVALPPTMGAQRIDARLHHTVHGRGPYAEVIALGIALGTPAYITFVRISPRLLTVALQPLLITTYCTIIHISVQIKYDVDTIGLNCIILAKLYLYSRQSSAAGLKCYLQYAWSYILARRQCMIYPLPASQFRIPYLTSSVDPLHPLVLQSGCRGKCTDSSRQCSSHTIACGVGGAGATRLGST